MEGRGARVKRRSVIILPTKAKGRGNATCIPPSSFHPASVSTGSMLIHTNWLHYSRFIHPPRLFSFLPDPPVFVFVLPVNRSPINFEYLPQFNRNSPDATRRISFHRPRSSRSFLSSCSSSLPFANRASLRPRRYRDYAITRLRNYVIRPIAIPLAERLITVELSLVRSPRSLGLPAGNETESRNTRSRRRSNNTELGCGHSTLAETARKLELWRNKITASPMSKHAERIGML